MRYLSYEAFFIKFIRRLREDEMMEKEALVSTSIAVVAIILVATSFVAILNIHTKLAVIRSELEAREAIYDVLKTALERLVAAPEVIAEGETHVVEMRAFQFGFEPKEIVVHQYDRVVINIVESSFERDQTYNQHSFTLPDFGVHVVLPPIPPGENVTIEFVADKVGEFAFECAIYCGVEHPTMRGSLKVLPREVAVAPELVEEVTLTTLEEIGKTLEVLMPEETLPDRVTWGGRVEDLMVVIEREAGSIAIINGANHTLLKHIEGIGARPHVISFTTDGRWGYITSRDGWLNKIDLYTLQLVRRVKIGFDTRGVAVSGDDGYVVVGNYIPNTAVILDAETLEPLKVIKTFGVDPDGEAVESRVAAVLDSPLGYFVIALKEAGQVWVISYKDPNFPVVATIEDAGRILHDAFLTPDGRFFMVASQEDDVHTVVDLERLTLHMKIPSGDKPHPGPGAIWRNLAFSPSIGEGNVTVWDIETWEVVACIPTAGPGLFIRSYERGETGYNYIWVDVVFGPENATIQVIDVETLSVVKTMKPGFRSLHPEFTYDGNYVYVSVWDENKVVVYHAYTFEVVAEITGVETPTGIFNVDIRARETGA